MKKIFLSTLIALSVFTFNSCERNFEEINTDTSRIKEPSVGSFLVPIQYEMGSYGYNRADDFTFDIMQVALDFPNEGATVSRYYLTESTGNGYWNTSYKWLKQVKELNEAAKKEQNNNYLAISKVLNAWIMSNLTDAFGDVPMTEALRLEEGIMRPKYDKQKDIYMFLLDDLKEANTLFDETKTLSEGDLFFQANASTAGIVKWKKFCNSLSLRLLTRILKRNGEVNVNQRIADIVNDPVGHPIFQSNADGVVLDISGVAPLLPPIARPQDFTAYRASGGFFTQTLVDNNDPRLSLFFTQAKSIPGNANIGYKGAPSGYALGTAFDYQPSNLNQNLAKAPLKILVMPYAELQFILAELAYKKIITGSARTFYENGVKATLEQWGATVPANYFDNPKVAYDDSLERIMLQKYVALFFVDHQQWYEQRRTGLPVLPNNGGLMNDAKMPQRMLYPTVTKVQNYDNYVIASQNMGGDHINTKMWWNK
ncbi:SusD/RagB family nutrient-binding outer membrane lipoprotein [Chryseobacterium pennipullorum]|uniref:SusD/RagB family nutrient-binding outer membrane lipoprotein n=1 Tax=Chryseobacterium pennipullorum TaxID=2258963 RepID=A0A3D9B229_9FLAO|nr:SusD/RagB family nutrient-binding outer membrane lipoprotein [Chryseobacterium pennipullorum]REC47316.1 SusD/RagB family nutrient-binding outer membrane lipoprotein [Chryseobacterium pennipullorum]